MQPEMTRLVSQSFFAFVLKCYASINDGRTLEIEPYLQLLAKKLNEVAKGDVRQLVVTMPPRHGKTFLASICLPAWILAHDPSARILIVTYGAELSEEIVPEIRAIMRTEWYKRTFGTRLAKKTVDDLRTTVGGKVQAVSIEGAITGKGADYIIADDCLQIKDHDNAMKLERLIRLFNGVVRTRLNNPREGAIVIIAHRLNEDDLPGHMLREGGWKHLKLPLVAPRDRIYDLGNGKEWYRRKGELLRPRAFTPQQVRALRTSSRQPSFETLQQQSPGDGPPLRIRPEDFPTFAADDFPMSELPVVLSIDPSLKHGLNGSFSCIQVYSPYRDCHLLRAQWREQVAGQELLAACRHVIKVYRPSVVLIEDTAAGPMLLRELGPRQGMALVRVPQPREDKVTRLRRHRPLIRAGGVQLLRGAPGLDDFRNEVALFPNAAFDDQVDALSQYLDYIAKHPNPPVRAAQAIGVIGGANSVPTRGEVTQIRGAVMAKSRW
jgi:predicted phage terminase large subunit-like protein